jgi:hypothetical protein
MNFLYKYFSLPDNEADTLLFCVLSPGRSLACRGWGVSYGLEIKGLSEYNILIGPGRAAMLYTLIRLSL